MIPLTPPELKKIIETFVYYLDVHTADTRLNFLEQAGLAKFSGSLNLEGSEEEFCQELFRELNHSSARTDEGDFAIVILLRYVQAELAGHIELQNFIETLLTRKLQTTPPPTATVSSFSDTREPNAQKYLIIVVGSVFAVITIIVVMVYLSSPSIFPTSTSPSAPNSQSFAIAIGDEVSRDVPAMGAGNIEVAGSEDSYTFMAQEGQTIFIQTIDSIAIAPLTISLTDETNTVLYEAFFQDKSGSVRITRSGIHTLRINNRRNDAPNVGIYSFKIWEVPSPTTYEIAIGDEVSRDIPAMGAGNIEVPGSEDIYTFMAQEGQTIFIQTMDGSAIAPLTISLADETNTVLDEAFFLDKSGLIRITRSGIYTLRINNRRNDVPNIGTYSFKIWEVPRPTTYEIAIGDEVSRDMPAVGAGNIEVPGSEDIYTFMAQEGQTVFIQTIDDSAIANLTITLTDETNAVLYEAFFLDESGSIRIVNSGLHTLRINNRKNNASNTGVYSFRILAE